MNNKNILKSVNVTGINTFLPLFFIILFGAGSLLFIPMMFQKTADTTSIFITFLIMFSAVLTGYIIVYRNIHRNRKVKKHGKVFKAKVLGYKDDNTEINELPCQIVKLLVDIGDGEKEYFYKLQNTNRDYVVGTTIDLLTYNNFYLIKDDDRSKREKWIIIFAIFFTISINLLMVPEVVNSTVYNITGINLRNEIKMKRYERNHSEIRKQFNDLRYEIPDIFKLSSYHENYFYDFASKNDDHECSINILSYDKDKIRDNESHECVGSFIEKDISGEIWCVKTEKNGSNSDIQYTIYYGDYYYFISFRLYKDNDELCSLSFAEFEKSLHFIK